MITLDTGTCPELVLVAHQTLRQCRSSDPRSYPGPARPSTKTRITIVRNKKFEAMEDLP